MHILPIGVEHLATGLEITPTSGHGVKIEATSGSLFMLISDSPFSIYWPGMGLRLDSISSEPYSPKKFTTADVVWYANTMARAMRDAYFDKKPEKSKLPRK